MVLCDMTCWLPLAREQMMPHRIQNHYFISCHLWAHNQHFIKTIHLCQTFHSVRRKRSFQLNLDTSDCCCYSKGSMSSFLPQTVWWQWLHGVAVQVYTEMLTQADPFLCWSHTLLPQAGWRPRRDQGHEAQARRWAGWGSGHNPTIAGRRGLGEMLERIGWSWRRCWKEGKWSCRKEELLLWLWSDWVRWKALQLNASSSPCPEGGMVGMRS